jgi:hypothetical protein
MSADQLRKFLDETPKAAFAAWFLDTISKARRALAVEFKKGGRSNPYLLDPDTPFEVVGETMVRIAQGRLGYVWSGEGPFEFFFDVCVVKTVRFVHSRTRPDRQRTASMDPAVLERVVPTRHHVPPDQLAIAGAALFQKTLATIMASSKLNPSGATAKYMHRIDHYVAGSLSKAEICDDLGIKPETLGSVRVRARREFGDPEKD